MPDFVVRFDRPVTYQFGHPKGQREVTELTVSASSRDAAMQHAIRVTRGEAAITVTEAA